MPRFGEAICLPRFTDGRGKALKYRRRRFLLLKRKHLRIIIIILAVVVATAVIVVVASSNSARSVKQHAVEALAEKGMLNIGLRGDIGALCTFNEETGVFEGLEKDVVDEIVRRLFPDGIIVNYVSVNSETKDAQLKLGNIDIALGASVNVEKSGIAYTASYFADANALLVQEGQITNSALLDGKTIGVVQGSVADQDSEKDEEISVLQEYLKGQGVEVAVRRYASYPEAVDGLREGNVAAVCASEINLKLFGIKGMLVLPDRFLPSRYCVQLSTSQSALVDVLDDVIADMKKDGTIDALVAKWNLVDYSALG